MALRPAASCTGGCDARQTAAATLAPLQLLLTRFAPQDKLSHGVLPNGMRYYVRSNARPAQRAALSLVVCVGSLAEEEAERGVAHFLEHLAFNATELYDRHALVAHLESAGLEFGACQNAFTSCDETCFELLVPLDVPDLLMKTFCILAQFASRIRIAPDDVEAERGAILEEWRSGRSSGGRAAEAAWKLLHAGSLYADRLPIGLESVIRGVSSETIRKFYSKWYWPQNMALVAVGDWSDEERHAVVESVTQLFGELGPPVGAAAASPTLPVAGVAAHAEPRAACHMEPALTQSRCVSAVRLSRNIARHKVNANPLSQHPCGVEGAAVAACVGTRLPSCAGPPSV